MNDTKSKMLSRHGLATLGILALVLIHPLAGQSADELQAEVRDLQARLSQAEAALAEARMSESVATERAVAAETRLEAVADSGPSKITIGNFTIGGAIRANYTWGSYTPELDRPSRAEEDNGTIQLDIFRVNVDYSDGPWSGKFEYRFYPGYGSNNSDSYNMLHTGWVGYDFDEGGQLQVGVNRVPFGPGAYGISQSWFFDQHYYLGFADDMDLGIKYTNTKDNLSYAFAYYFSDEGSWAGENFSSDSVRYSYDIVDESGMGYEERNQFNARVLYSLQSEVPTTIGASVQWGELKSNGDQDDGSQFAISGHMVNQINNWKIASQLTYYDTDVDASQPLGTDELVQMGAFDFASLAPAEAWIAGVSVSYYKETPNLPWLDYVIPYIEYSSIMKRADGFNDSDLFVVGAAWGRGGWYIYTDYALSNGNDFVGNEGGYGANPAPGFSSNRHGANPNDDWQYRVNINFGYYF